MKLSFECKDLRHTTADVTAIFVHQDEKSLSTEMRWLQRKLGTRITAYQAGDFKGKDGESALFYMPRGTSPRRYVVVGLGERKKASPEQYRRAAAAAAKHAKSLHASSLALYIPRHDQRLDEIVSALSEGAYLALYKFDRYVSKAADSPREMQEISICTEEDTYLKRGSTVVERTGIVCEATALARNLGNAPGNEIFPETLANAAHEASTRCGFSATILDQREIAELGMGGILGVSQGSAHPPRFIILEYGEEKKRPVVLIGKGVTFDSGGISIKPSAGMAEMKMDMSGAAAVIGTFEAVTKLKLPVHIVGLIPAVENMPSGSSIRPGDILRHYNGKTSEVDNTDAEGRLILADALAYAEQYKPAAVIDLATLTGAVVVALGHIATGMMGNNKPLMDKLHLAGEATYERVWELPLFEEYEKLVKSDVADVKNVGGRWAGAITGAMFLKKFVGSYPWVHLDIAGTAMLEEDGSYAPKGASGVGVRLLTELLRRWR